MEMLFKDYKVDYDLEARKRYIKQYPVIFDGIIFIENEALGKKWLVNHDTFSLSTLVTAISFKEADNKNIKRAATEKIKYHDGYLGLSIADEEEITKFKEEVGVNPELGNLISDDILFSIRTLHPSDDTTGYIYRTTLLKLCDYGKVLIDESKSNFVNAPWLFRQTPIYSNPFDLATGYSSSEVKESIVEKEMVRKGGMEVDCFLKEHDKSIDDLYQLIMEDTNPLRDVLMELGLLSDKEKNQKLYYLQSWDGWELSQSGTSPFHNLRLLYILLFFQDEIKAQQEAKEAEAKRKEEEANRPMPEGNYDFNKERGQSPLYFYDSRDKEKRYPIINEDYLKGLDRQVKELYDLKKKLPNEELNASITAKRKFLIEEMKACGFTSESQDEENVSKVLGRLKILGLEYLSDYYKNISHLLTYITSDARKEYCPEYFPENESMYGADLDYAEEGSLLNSQISLEWFGNSKNLPPDYDANVWLAKCECLFKNSSYKDKPGMLFSKIDNRRVKIVIEYDDGINLRMVSGELMS